MTVQANASVAKIEVGGRTYAAVHERRCRVCCSGPLRERIEEETVAGQSWASIAGDLPVDAGLNARNLRDHFANGHLPIHEPTVRALADRQAVERGYVVEQAVEIAVDYLGFCHTVVGTVSKGVLNGKIRPTVRDGIAAAALLARYDPGPDRLSHEDYSEAFAAYHSTVADVLTSDQFAELGNRFANDPVLQELSRQWEERHG